MSELQRIREWGEFLAGARNLSANTVQQYKYSVLRMLSETPRDSLSEITEQDVVVFLASLGRRAHSKTLYVRGLTSFFGWAAERGFVDVDPTRHVKPRTPPPKDADAFSPEEVVAVIQAARM